LTEELIDLPNGRYTDTEITIDTLGHEVIHGQTPEFEIARTGYYRGKRANLGYSLARRSGWLDTSSICDVSNYLDNSQSSNNKVLVGTTYYIRSSSSQDGNGGTGIRSMRINSLDALGNRTISTVSLTGTTAVSLGNNFSFIQYMESETVGSSDGAVGDITISTVTGAPTVAQTVEKITVGDSRSMSGRVKVPTGFSMYLRGFYASAFSAAMDVRIRGQAFTDDRSLSQGFHFQQSAYLANGANSDFDFEYLKFPSGAEIKISAISSQAGAGNRCDANFHFILLEN